MAVDNAPNTRVPTIAHLTDSTALKNFFNLSACIAYYAYWNTRSI
jgi:hypothetical protein